MNIEPLMPLEPVGAELDAFGASGGKVGCLRGDWGQSGMNTEPLSTKRNAYGTKFMQGFRNRQNLNRQNK